MPNSGTYYYGYLVHVPRTVKNVLSRSPVYVRRVQANGVADWLPSILDFAAETFGRECGIEDLTLRSAWIGNGRKGFIWILPPEMRKMKDNEPLKAFKSLMGIHGDPVVFFPIDEPEPAYLRNIGTFQKEIEEMLVENCYERFKSAEFVGETLAQDMTRLTLDAAQG